MAGSSRSGPLLLGGLALVSVALALVVDPGPFSIDEATYQHMVQSVRRGHGLAVWNGYEEFATPELTSQWIRPSGDRLFGQYPYFYVLLAVPFQALMGFRGLFVLNAVAFALATWLCFRLALRLFDTATALLGAASFAIASYAANYAIAAWPHMVSVALTLAACELAGHAWRAASPGRGRTAGAEEAPPGRASWYAAASGIMVGLNAGVRIDSVLVAPLVIAPFALARPVRWRALASVALGAFVPLAALTVINAQRWGAWSPLSYGRSVTRHIPVMTVLFLVLALGCLVWHFRDHPALKRRRGPALYGAAAAAVASLALPSVRELAMHWARGAWTLLVDLAALPAERIEPALSRTAAGGVVYAGTLKRALLQSCPHFAVIITLLALWRADEAPAPSGADPRPPPPSRWEERAALLGLLAVPALATAFYARNAWHGGLAFNLRYFCTSLPFLSIVGARALIRLARKDARAHVCLGAIAFVVAGAVLLSLPVWQLSAVGAETWLADVPLSLAALTSIAALVWILRPSRELALCCTGITSVGAAWAMAAGIGYDSVHAQHVRAANYALGTFVGEHTSDDSLLFVHSPDPFYSALDRRRDLRIAIPANDRFRDMVPLANFHLVQGRPVFAVFRDDLWDALEKLPAARLYHLDPIARMGPYSLRRLRARNAARAPAEGAAALSKQL